MWITSMGNHGAVGGISERRRSSCSSLCLSSLIHVLFSILVLLIFLGSKMPTKSLILIACIEIAIVVLWLSVAPTDSQYNILLSTNPKHFIGAHLHKLAIILSNSSSAKQGMILIQLLIGSADRYVALNTSIYISTGRVKTRKLNSTKYDT